ncbi:MAG: hypothetical protein E7508_00760 [Ruminococcus sp.]|nr:hypothetical protein [Ruminococcus sp.]
MENQKIKFHLPDFTIHAKMNLTLLNMIKNAPQYFYDNLEIASFYGAFPPSMWNGGRTVMHRPCDKNVVKSIVNAFNSQGVPLRFTFTNPVLKEEHLKDEFCNMVMEVANNGLNEVIVFSPLLEDYIRNKYPKYKVTSSTCKRILDVSQLSEEMNKDYHIVVLDYDLNNKFDILERIPHREKCEILVNSCCVPGCRFRSEEYEIVGRQQILYCEHLKKHPGKPFDVRNYNDKNITDIKCPSDGNSIFDSKKRSHHVSPEMIINKYLPLGINQFKIEGRTATKLFLIECYMYYLVKPECRDEARFLFLHNLEKNGLIRIDG